MFYEVVSYSPLTSEDLFVAMSVAAVSLASALLEQRGAVLAAILGRLKDLAAAGHHAGAAALVALAPGTPVTHLAVQH